VAGAVVDDVLVDLISDREDSVSLAQAWPITSFPLVSVWVKPPRVRFEVGSLASTVSTDNTLGSLDRGLAVLEFLGRRGEVRLAELARELGTSRTTMFRVVETLRGRGFAEHVAASHTYRLGPGAQALAAQATRSAINRLAEPVLAELRNETARRSTWSGCTAAGSCTRRCLRAVTPCGACRRWARPSPPAALGSLAGCTREYCQTWST